ncbi:EAL domain-containing protein [Rhodobacteraceae bacterium 2CG4]|uniref:EAL domain-containing protein n=1 Tax=Halovulum marinum TaxID=2662447 RepID=A0A6L5YVV1_9RHOB|nr:EAL domain-containing protein [Halovulum marinum]MSU88180.1 EAL domain-containing protein [Halovulum marinum]
MYRNGSAEQTNAAAHLPAPMRIAPAQTVAATRAMVIRALGEDRVTAVFQPVVDTRDTRRIAFHEALVRIRTASGALLAPNQFLPALSDTPLAAAVDRAMLRQVLAALRRHPDLRLAVNVCPATCDGGGWLRELDAAARHAPDLAYRLIVEVAEDTGPLEDPGRHDFLSRLRHMGVSTALDDFGAGRTGFAQFRQQRFDIVKIDGSYGDGLARDRDAQALVRALVALASHFEMLSVIEFIDNAEDARCAKALGVDAMQGFLFGRPVVRLPGSDDDSDDHGGRAAC